MNILKRVGPMTEPWGWGTPLITGRGSDSKPFIVTTRLLFFLKADNQASMKPHTPTFLSFKIRLL